MTREINVLILSAGRRVELVNAFRAARARLGFDGLVHAADLCASAPALVFADRAHLLPRTASEEYLDALIRLCQENRISLVVPTIDTELTLLARERDRIAAESGAIVQISSPECVAICRDKVKTAEFFRKHGFGIPKTYCKEQLDRGEYDFPLFIKPRDGSSSIGAFRVNNQEELTFFRRYVSDPIVQECVSGTEYTLDIFTDFQGNIVSIVPRIRLAVRGGEILKGRIDMNPSIIAEARRLVARLRPCGHITVQGILGEDGLMRYLEINPRFGGGAPMSIAAGADSCEWLYRLCAGEKIDSQRIAVDDGASFARFDQSVRIDL